MARNKGSRSNGLARRKATPTPEAPVTAPVPVQAPAEDVEVVEPESESVPVVDLEPPFTITIQSSEETAEDGPVNNAINGGLLSANDNDGIPGVVPVAINLELLDNKEEANAAINNAEIIMTKYVPIHIKPEPIDYEYETNEGTSNVYGGDVPTITIQSSEPEVGDGDANAAINDLGSCDNMLNSDNVTYVTTTTIKTEPVDAGYEVNANNGVFYSNVTLANIKEEPMDAGYGANAAINGLLDSGITHFIKRKDVPNFPGGSDDIPGVTTMRLKEEPVDEYEAHAAAAYSSSDSVPDNNSQLGFASEHNFTVSEALEELQEHLALIPTIGKIKGKAFVEKLRIVFESYYPSIMPGPAVADVQTAMVAEGTENYCDVLNFMCLRVLIEYMDSRRYLLSQDGVNATVDNDLCDLSLIMEICRDYFDATKEFLQMREHYDKTCQYPPQNANVMQYSKVD